MNEEQFLAACAAARIPPSSVTGRTGYRDGDTRGVVLWVGNRAAGLFVNSRGRWQRVTGGARGPHLARIPKP